MEPIKLPSADAPPTPPRAPSTSTPPLTPLSRYLMLPDPEEDTTPTSTAADQNHRLAQRVNLKVVSSSGVGGGVHRKKNTLELSFQKGALARDSPKVVQSSLSGANRSLNHLVEGKDQRTPQSLERNAQAHVSSSAEPTSTSALSGQRKISFGSGTVPPASALERRFQQISAPPVSAAADAAAKAAAAAGSPGSSAPPPAFPAAAVPATGPPSRSHPAAVPPPLPLRPYPYPFPYPSPHPYPYPYPYPYQP